MLVAGFATRHVARSAHAAGYEVYAVDHFCDKDLSWYTRECVKFEELAELSDRIAGVAARHSIDMLVVTSGAESIDAVISLCGTPRDRVERFLDKLEIQRFFEGLGVPVPPLGKGAYPAMIKPRRGAGGWRNTIVNSEEEEQAWEAAWPDVPYITQQLVGGIPASVSCIANGTEAVCVAANEQLLRGEGVSAHGFCGSLTPYRHPLTERMLEVGRQIAAASGCLGSVGIDFMLDRDSVWAIEINPRFQATLDTVEMATGYNLFSMHVDACRGILPVLPPDKLQTAVRRILFTDRDIVIREDLSPLAPAIADIPWPGTHIEEGHAVVSVYGWGANREEALWMLDNHITTVRRYMERW